MFLNRDRIRKKSRLAYAALIISVIAVGAVSTTAMKSSFAQNASNTVTPSPFDQYIMAQQPSLAPLATKALSPTGNASLSSDLSDIVSTGQLLASKEFAAAGKAQNASKPFVELRYANSALDVDKHLISLVTQYEWDNHQGQQARASEQVSDLAGLIQNIQWKEVRIYEISQSVAKYKLSQPDGMNHINAEIASAKQDVNNAIAEENNGTDYKAIDTLLRHASKQLQTAEPELRESSWEVDTKVDIAKGETTIDKLINRLHTTADYLDAKAENQKNSEALSEISTARAELDQAQTAEGNGDNASAMHEVRDASTHLLAAASLMV